MKPQLNIAIFVIDDNEDMVDAIGELLKVHGFSGFHLFTDPNKLLDALHENVHICVVDYHLNASMNGLQVIEKVVERNPYCYFIMLSGTDDKSVPVKFVNMVYGGRYVEKGEKNTNDMIIKYLTEIVSHIHSVSDTYSTFLEIKKEVNNLKSIRTNDLANHTD